MLDAASIANMPAAAPAPLRVIAKAADVLIALIVVRLLWPYGWIVAAGYLLLADGLMDGRSVGKRLFGLRVVHPETGQPCSLRSSALRNFPFAVMGLLAGTGLIGQIIAILVGGFSAFMEINLVFRDANGLRVGDIVGETSVVLASRFSPASPVAGSPPAAPEQPAP